MADVVVLGGGVVGCATAYYLAREGAAVVVVEREGVGSQASGFAAGGLFPLQGYGVPGPLSEFAMHAFKMHQELSKPLQEESGVDFQYRMPLRMQLAFGESDIPTLEESARLFKDASGFSSRWLDADEVRRIEPRIAPNVVRGIELKGSAAVDSHLFANALMRAAEKHGARVVSGEVTGVKADGEKITAAIVDGQPIAAAQFVVTTGPW
ncbi:MAG: FAD-dependent oxidoreductase, partial [Chloroflexi bacterium]|nr:FAD-dependent oxidoreductase [Chloroflexota bacterium]